MRFRSEDRELQSTERDHYLFLWEITKDRTNWFPKGWLYLILANHKEAGKVGEEEEWKQESLCQSSLSNHLFSRTFMPLMKKARDKWMEELDRSFLCCFPVEEGCLFPIPCWSHLARQPAKQPASQPANPPAHSHYPRNTACIPLGLGIPRRDIMGISWRGYE